MLKNSLNKDGIAIISTFGKSGPLACAGLEVVQYDEAKMTFLCIMLGYRL